MGRERWQVAIGSAVLLTLARLPVCVCKETLPRPEPPTNRIAATHARHIPAPPAVCDAAPGSLAAACEAAAVLQAWFQPRDAQWNGTAFWGNANCLTSLCHLAQYAGASTAASIAPAVEAIHQQRGSGE